MENERQIIMLVDDNQASLTMGKNILKDKYAVYPIPGGAKLFEILEKITPALILLDVSMPEMDGYEVIRRLKASRKTQDVPVVFLTSRDDPGNELEGLSLGAIDYISKPFSPALLVQRIANHLLLETRKKELENYNRHLSAMEDSAESGVMAFSVLGALAEAPEFRRNGQGERGGKVSSYLKVLLDGLAAKGIYRNETASWEERYLLHAARLHDVGKLFIGEEVLFKKSGLTTGEFAEIKKHPERGVAFLDCVSAPNQGHVFLEYSRVMAGFHHERWDGGGYPRGLKGTAIPLMGRLMALVDGYDALVSVRPYRNSFRPEEAEKMICDGKGAWLDPELVDVFGESSSRFAEIAGRTI